VLLAALRQVSSLVAGYQRGLTESNCRICQIPGAVNLLAQPRAFVAFDHGLHSTLQQLNPHYFKLYLNMYTHKNILLPFHNHPLCEPLSMVFWRPTQNVTQRGWMSTTNDRPQDGCRSRRFDASNDRKILLLRLVVITRVLSSLFLPVAKPVDHPITRHLSIVRYKDGALVVNHPISLPSVGLPGISPL
jgi:hypothetical protein